MRIEKTADMFDAPKTASLGQTLRSLLAKPHAALAGKLPSKMTLGAGGAGLTGLGAGVQGALGNYDDGTVGNLDWHWDRMKGLGQGSSGLGRAWDSVVSTLGSPSKSLASLSALPWLGKGPDHIDAWAPKPRLNLTPDGKALEMAKPFLGRTLAPKLTHLLSNPAMAEEQGQLPAVNNALATWLQGQDLAARHANRPFSFKGASIGRLLGRLGKPLALGGSAAGGAAALGGFARDAAGHYDNANNPNWHWQKLMGYGGDGIRSRIGMALGSPMLTMRSLFPSTWNPGALEVAQPDKTLPASGPETPKFKFDAVARRWGANPDYRAAPVKVPMSGQRTLSPYNQWLLANPDSAHDLKQLQSAQAQANWVNRVEGLVPGAVLPAKMPPTARPLPALDLGGGRQAAGNPANIPAYPSDVWGLGGIRGSV